MIPILQDKFPVLFLTSIGRGSDVMVPMAIPSFGGMLVVLICKRRSKSVPVRGCMLCDGEASVIEWTGAGWPDWSNGTSHLQGRHILSRTFAFTPRSKAGAGCGNSARPDLRGGMPERAVPTATHKRTFDMCVNCPSNQWLAAGVSTNSPFRKST